VVGSRGSWFGGLSLAIQEIDGARDVTPIGVFDAAPGVLSSVAPSLPEPTRRSHSNRFAYGMLGTPLGNGLSIGASVQWAELNAIDGVELLYARSFDLAQFGHVVDARVGLLKDWTSGRSLEAMLVHNRTDMAHDVTYLEWFWDPDNRQVVPQGRVERNEDRTYTWGGHLEYEQPLAEGWRGGARLTANVASHPKIPNYEIMNIPRDPGRTHAYNLGLGVGRRYEGTTIGFDAIFEPIRSNTWADAAGPTATGRGDTLAAGARTVENWFRFANGTIRFGLSEELRLADSATVMALQLGVSLRTINYHLKQVDHVQGSERTMREQWNEWMPTWGLSVDVPRLTIAYRGSLTTGTGRPGVAGSFGGGFELQDAVAGSNVLIAPSGPLALESVSIVSHQISISLPLR
jgi:hypothetical protein